MSYQSLLFCPDEKTARTVTQVLTELEFAVEPCSEPFAAVKKLMGEHFDAIVVDCDNEQNATLLFKSARNSTSNQASWARAVVEGQAGGRKGCRLGGELGVPQPMNCKRAQGNAAPVAPMACKPALKNVPVSPISKAVAPPVAPSSTSAALSMGKAAFGTGAASAPAPARSGADPAVVEPAAFKGASTAEASFERAPESGMNESSVSVTAAASPSFSYGGADAAESSSGGSKKALIGIAAAAVIAVGLYVGWTQFRGQGTSNSSDSRPAAPPSDVAVHGSNPQPAASSTLPLSTTMSTPSPQTALQSKASAKSVETATAADNNDPSAKDQDPVPQTSSKASRSFPAAKPAIALKPDTAPIVMKKGGAPPSQTNAADAPAPSVMVAATGAGGSLPNLIGEPGASAKPVLETLNVSQGVSQGLLIKKVQPTYPPNALRMHVEGAVQILATIGKSGNITAVKTLTGEPLLPRPASASFNQC